MAKLKEEEVAQVRAWVELKARIADVARHFQVSAPTIRAVVEKAKPYDYDVPECNDPMPLFQRPERATKAKEIVAEPEFNRVSGKLPGVRGILSANESIEPRKQPPPVEPPLSKARTHPSQVPSGLNGAEAAPLDSTVLDPQDLKRGHGAVAVLDSPVFESATEAPQNVEEQMSIEVELLIEKTRNIGVIRRTLRDVMELDVSDLMSCLDLYWADIPGGNIEEMVYCIRRSNYVDVIKAFLALAKASGDLDED